MKNAQKHNKHYLMALRRTIESDFSLLSYYNSLALKDVNSDDYSAIYYTGGHGVMWDFPNNPELQKIAKDCFNNL